MTRRALLLLLLLPTAAVAAPPLQFVERLVGGAQAAQPVPLILAVHGLGDRPERFVHLFDRLPFPARIVAARGPTKHGPGYSWFPISSLPPKPTDSAMIAGIADSAKKLSALATWLKENRPVRGEPIVTGFSQGGILSFALAVHHPEPFAAAVPVAGALPPALRGPARIPLHALHGQADRVVLFEQGRQTTETVCATAKSACAFEPFPEVGHRVPPTVRAALFAALKSAAKSR